LVADPFHRADDFLGHEILIFGHQQADMVVGAGNSHFHHNSSHFVIAGRFLLSDWGWRSVFERRLRHFYN